MLRLIEAEASTAGAVRAMRGSSISGIAAILSCNARRNPMFDTLTPRSTTGEFENHALRPARSRRVPAGSPDRHTRSCSSHEGSGGTLRRTAERRLSTCPATRPATTAPGSATGFSISNTP